MVKNQSQVTHLFLDLDGTLINSLPKLKRIYHDFLQDHQIHPSYEEFEQLKTSSIETLIEFFKNKYSLNFPTHILKKEYERYLQKHYLSAPLFHGALDFLHFAKDKNIQIIITTASQKKVAHKILAHHKILELIDEIYTPSCFQLKQKDESYYKKVIKTLQLDTSRVLVVDDSLEVVSCSIKIGLKALLFSKINYHPLPSFGSWRLLLKEWRSHVYA